MSSLRTWGTVVLLLALGFGLGRLTRAPSEPPTDLSVDRPTGRSPARDETTAGPEKGGPEPVREELVLAPARAARKAGATDVVLVTIDTARADYYEPYGSDVPVSPVLAAFARQGVTFKNAYSTASWTSPAMASLMTGLYPSEHGIVLAAFSETQVGMQQSLLPEAATTLAEVLQGEGYRTFGVNTNMLLGAKLGFAQGYDQYVGTENADLPFPRVAVEALGGEIRASDKHFTWVHYYDPHWPYLEHAPWFGQLNDSPFRTGADFAIDAAKWAYRNEHSIPVDAGLPLEAVPHLQSYVQWLVLRPQFLFDAIRRLTHGPEGSAVVENHMRYLRAAYRSELRAVDQDIGLLFRDLGIDDETLVIVTADHGEEMFDHGDVGHSMASLYQELIRVPLVVRLPGGRLAGTVVDSPVSLVDVMPSLLDLLGIAAPGGLSGKSFVPLLDGKSQDPPREIVAELTHAIGGQYRTVVRYPWKYIHHYRAGGGELYDLASDPHEKRNRAKEEPARVAEMRSWLQAWTERTEQRWPDTKTVSVAPQDLLKLQALGYVGGD